MLANLGVAEAPSEFSRPGIAAALDCVGQVKGSAVS